MRGQGRSSVIVSEASEEEELIPPEGDPKGSVAHPPPLRVPAHGRTDRRTVRRHSRSRTRRETVSRTSGSGRVQRVSMVDQSPSEEET